MIPVSPNTPTTLVLNSHHQSYGRFCTARAAIRHMITGRVKGVDASGMDSTWNGADIVNINGVDSSYCWKDVTVTLYPGQPCLRSAPNPTTGEETQWPVPTIIVCTYHFGFPAKRGDNVSLRTIYAMAKGVCQYCFNKIPFSEATKDHIYPQTLGGSNDDFNLVLACKPCNSRKDAQYPYLDANGNLPIGTTVHHYLSYLYHGIDIRPEWHPYLYLGK